ncbi:hypothetical protein N9L02_02365 [Gammaproteobacteria bacterium]|nr:hypothetical protein [Gammaproteobacteria bacterium]
MTYLSSANEKQVNTKTIPNFAIISFTVIICLIAYLLFPANSIQKTAITRNQPELVTYFYLLNLLKKYPSNEQLRIALINQEIPLKKWHKASLEIRKLGENSSYIVMAKILDFYLDYNKYFDSSRFKTDDFLLRLQNKIKEISTLSLPNDQLIGLGESATGLKLPAVALIFYSQVKNEKNPNILRKFAITALWASNYLKSSEYYFNASQNEKNIELSRKDIINAFNSLLQGGEYVAIKKKVRQLPQDILNNEKMLKFLINLCISAGDTKMASKLSIKLLEFSGNN